MSWHTNAIFIRSDFERRPENVLRALGLDSELVESDLGFEEASSSSNDDIGVGFANDWTVIFGGVQMFSIDSPRLLEISKDSDVFEMMLEGSSGTAGFTWYSNGENVREYLSQEGEAINDEGEKLELEIGLAPNEDAEQFVLELMTRLTIPMPVLWSIRFSIFDVG
jgi:hypothetical protein